MFLSLRLLYFKESLPRLSNSAEEYRSATESPVVPPRLIRSLRPECILTVRNNQRALLHAVCSYIWWLALFFTCLQLRVYDCVSKTKVEYKGVSFVIKECVMVAVISRRNATGRRRVRKSVPNYFSVVTYEVCPNQLWSAWTPKSPLAALF